MTENDWLELAESVLADTSLTTRFPKGHAACAALPEFHPSTGFATWKHEGQLRKGDGNTPYIHHPIEVAAILAEVGDISDLDVLRAAVLHDTIEDTATTSDELETHFGSRVCSIVLEVSDDTSLKRLERKAAQITHAPHLTTGAQVLKLADKISNVHDVAFSKPVDWAPERQLAYFDWACLVFAGFRGCNPALEALFDEQVARSREAVGA
jgi:guanosine-3',5'-bis(diphosphate) 3'-pyrophosphohydrolase